MRYLSSESTMIAAKFPTGSTVTIDVIRVDGTDTLIHDGVAMAEVFTTGLFKYSFSQTAHTEYREFFWIATDGTVKKSGKFGTGGQLDTVLNTVMDNQALIIL